MDRTSFYSEIEGCRCKIYTMDKIIYTCIQKVGGGEDRFEVNSHEIESSIRRGIEGKSLINPN